MSKLVKRPFLFLATLMLLLGLAACSKDAAKDPSKDGSGDAGGNTKDEKVEIRFSWWGDTSRNEVYNGIVDRFEDEHPNITVKREFGRWDDYWNRLATQIAGGNAPDVVSMHQFYVSDYAGRNALLNLNNLVDSQKINLSDFPEAAVDSGKLNGDIYMVAKGLTMPGLAYSTATFDELGVEYPKFDWTWDEFIAKVTEIQQAIGSEINWATGDMSGGQLQPLFRYYVRQNGKDLFTEDGQLGFDKEDLVEWWAMWDNLRQQGVIP